MNNVLVLQRSGSVAPTDYYKVGSSPFDTIRQHDTLGQIRNVDVRSDHGQTSYSELLYGNADSQLVNILNPLGPKSDQRQISPCNISAL